MVKKKGSTTQKYSLTKMSMSINAILEIRKDIQCLPVDFASFIEMKICSNILDKNSVKKEAILSGGRVA